MLAKSLGNNVGLAQLPGDMSRVVIAEHPGATDGVRAISAANVQIMMDEAIKRLTDKATVADAWSSILPGYEADHTIAIKVNCVTNLLPSHREVVDSIVTGLTAAGVPENNIIIYDIATWFLTGSGYKRNMGEEGVRCFGTNRGGGILGQKPIEEDGWGHDWDNPLDINGREVFLSTIVTRCDHLINVPPLKWHPMSQVTLALKNHYGSINNPQLLHGNINTAIPTLYSQAAIKDKTRLVVTDALFGCWTGNQNPPNFASNTLIVTEDPVAADHIGAQMLIDERKRLKVWAPDSISSIEKAAEMGLGTNDPEKMEILELKLEGEFEKEDGKAVEPADKYRTQWGSVKTIMR